MRCGTIESPMAVKQDGRGRTAWLGPLDEVWVRLKPKADVTHTNEGCLLGSADGGKQDRISLCTSRLVGRWDSNPWWDVSGGL
ncbi:hypothetical protein CBM2634_U340002 [Cupriavidus taiwanensis]|uniref:Uncharacterized protein n=1 Tax=Cupriavidus taiwanensis TaxID=164546 RepID=A0A375JCB1_9BURK|nr:hypothetical protein CBM2634_U340002 [Cupriavidus taiwanensis]